MWRNESLIRFLCLEVIIFYIMISLTFQLSRWIIGRLMKSSCRNVYEKDLFWSEYYLDFIRSFRRRNSNMQFTYSIQKIYQN